MYKSANDVVKKATIAPDKGLYIQENEVKMSFAKC